MQDLSVKVLSEVTTYMKYSRFLPEVSRRETWEESVLRNMLMHIKKYPSLEKEIRDSYKFVFDKKVLPSMRSMQFGGRPIELSPNRAYNCSYLAIDSWQSFSEVMFLLLGGSGVGYSVQKHHVNKLPEIKKPTKRKKRHLIGDSIEGWADAIKVLMKAYFFGESDPDFDFSDIRPKGTLLKTSGGKAPGPQPLKDCIHNIRKILDAKEPGDKLTPLEVHDLLCWIADAVLSGGIRRAALISLFSFDDEEMLSCKFGNWWESNPQRGRANNSVCLLRHKIKKQDFFKLWEKIKASKAGEPGIFFTNNAEWGTNPSLRKGTRVLTSEGIFPIEKLEGKEFYVKNLNGELSLAKCWLSGVGKRLYKINLTGGHSYHCTAEHKWPIWDGEKFVRTETTDIKPDQYLPILKSNSLFDGKEGTYNDGFAVGWLYGDGWITQRKDTNHREFGYIVSSKDNESEICFKLIQTLKQNCKGFNGNFNLRNNCFEISINNKEVDEYFKNFEVDKKENGLPKFIFEKASEEFRKGFIDALFSSDGCVEKNDKRIVLTTAHSKLAKDFSELLGFYGIRTSIKETQRNVASFPNGKNYDKNYIRFDISIGRNEDIRHFKDLFKLSNINKQKIINEYSFKQTKDSNLLRVISVEKTDINEDVWDISVYDDTHCFQLGHAITGNCGEIALRANQFCNLCEVNVSNIESQEDLNERVKAAAFIGTLQAGYTNFHYLRDEWKDTTEKEALLGIGMTGIASGKVLKMNLPEAAKTAVNENKRVSKLIGIKPAARVTCVKPSGTTSLVLGTSSGIHPWYNDYYIRRIRVLKDEPIYKYLVDNLPKLIEDDYFKPTTQAIISLPVKAPSGAIIRHESSLDLLERIKKIYNEWVEPGHNKGENTHNVSATIYVKDNEWDEVGEWMWQNRNCYSGITVLPNDNGSYIQAPHEDCTEEKYKEMLKYIKDIDLSQIMEYDDNTDLKDQAACAGGACEIK